MLHYYLHVYFYGFILCVVIIVCIFMGISYICLLSFSYESMHLHMYFPVMLYIYIYIHKSFVCLYFNCMQFKKFMWLSSIGCWVCYSMFHEENESILSRIVSRPGWPRTLQYGIRASIFNTEPGWAENVELKQNFTKD
jgi:hypothetical protein